MLRSRDLPVEFARNSLEIIQKLTHDEMRHTTHRMCISSSRGPFPEMSEGFRTNPGVDVTSVQVVGGSEKQLVVLEMEPAGSSSTFFSKIFPT